MDKRFKFRLQNVLDLKIEEEENLKHIFSKIQNEKNKIELEIEDLEKKYKNYSNIKPDVDLITQKITRNYLYSIEKSIELKTSELNQKKIELENSKKQLINKQIEKKSIEKLKEKRYEEFLEAEKIKEQLLLDEFSMINYIRLKKIK